MNAFAILCVTAASLSTNLSGRIDQHFERHWQQHGISPAPVADDAEFLRRVYLDLAGKLPPPAVVRQFLADESPDKRARVIAGLLSSPAYVNHFAAFWRDVLLPETKTGSDVQFLALPFELWLQRHLVLNTPYDEMVRQLLTTPLTTPNVNRAASELPAASAAPFFLAKQASPENLAAATSRVLLGLRIECAQCHDHPFDEWKREEFWGFAAFFGGIRPAGPGTYGSVQEVFDRRELMIPETQTVVQAAYLDRTTPRWRPREGARQTLANWITAARNPYFAKATVNRVWGLLMGYGLVDPVDDFSRGNPASHPVLLDEMADEFVAQGFDLRLLLQAIANSRVYQLTSRATHASQEDPHQFARMTLRGLSSHQINNCLQQARGAGPSPDARGSAEELARLAGSESSAPRDHQPSVLFALAAMNGAQTSAAADVRTSPVLTALLSFPMTDAERVESLYLTTLSRFPTPAERKRMLDHVTDANPDALGDVLWVLLNSSEFLVNH